MYAIYSYGPINLSIGNAEYLYRLSPPVKIID